MTTNAVASGWEANIFHRLRSTALRGALLAILGLGMATARAQSIDREAFLKAVAEVETGGNPMAIGPFGERGLYQFNRPTWRRYTKRPFTDAHNSRIAHDVAVQHFIWLYRRLAASGREPTPYRLAMAWNGGLGCAISGRAVRSTRDYARRVSVLTGLHPTAPAAVTAVAARLPDEAPVRCAGDESKLNPVRLDFRIDETLVAAYSAPEVVPVSDPSEEPIFSLAPAGTTETKTSAHFFFATIGE